MTDYATHAFGSVDYPLTEELDNSFLKDADPALYWILDYVAWAIDRHAGARIEAEATRCKVPIKQAVGSTTPWDPSRALVDKAFSKYPVLGLYRTSEKFTEHSRGWLRSDGTWELLYVLPPIPWQQWEKFSPVLRTVARVVLLALEQGHDPSYESNAAVYDEDHAGIQSISVGDAAYGTIDDSEGLITYAVTMTITVKERQSPTNFSAMTRADHDVTVHDPVTNTDV
jgi:hypothetical protein